jgi:hypothetical protein
MVKERNSMQEQPPAGPLGLEMIAKALGQPLKAGQIGVVMAAAGVGKTACLTHIAFEHLLRGLPLLHVCIDEVPDKIKLRYQELARNVAELTRVESPAALQRRIESLRFIIAYLHHTFNPAKLRQSLHELREQAGFRPSMAILDGLEFEPHSEQSVSELRQLAQDEQISLWMSALTHRHIPVVNDRGIPAPCHQSDQLFDTILSLEPQPESIRVTVLKHDGTYQPRYQPVFLNAQTYLIETG